MESASSPPYAIDVDVDEAFVDRVDVENLKAAATATLRSEKVARAALTIVITDDTYMRSLNRQFRGIDAPTDVLSFAAQEAPDSPPMIRNAPPELTAEIGGHLGDLVLAFPHTKRQAQQYANSVDAELRLLVVHGTLHLLGYDHASDEERRLMWAIQDRVLARFGQSTPVNRDD